MHYYEQDIYQVNYNHQEVMLSEYNESIGSDDTPNNVSTYYNNRILKILLNHVFVVNATFHSQSVFSITYNIFKV